MNETFNLERTPDGKGFNIVMPVDDKQNLMVLFDSAYWKTYRKVLMTQKRGYELEILQVDDPNKVLKLLGLITGLNLAINQLGILVAQFKAMDKKAETKNEKIQ